MVAALAGQHDLAPDIMCMPGERNEPLAVRKGRQVQSRTADAVEIEGLHIQRVKSLDLELQMHLGCVEKWRFIALLARKRQAEPRQSTGPGALARNCRDG